MTDALTCSAVLALVEPIAAGDAEVSDGVRAHLETCPRCASALASARRIEAALAAREAPPAPAGFTASVLARVRREQWRAEQRVDRVFNVVIAVSVLGLAAAALALLNVDVVLAAASAAWELAGTAMGETGGRSGPSLLTWAGAAAFMGFALGLWWLAEQRLLS